MRFVGLTLALFFLLGNAWGQGAGQGAYEHHCSCCHGSDATGDESGPNIVSKLAGRDDTELEAFIQTGRPASGMPAFNSRPNEMDQLVLYLRIPAPTSHAQVRAVVRKRVETVDGQTIDGVLLSDCPAELQLRTESKKILLLRKVEGDRINAEDLLF